MMQAETETPPSLPVRWFYTVSSSKDLSLFRIAFGVGVFLNWIFYADVLQKFYSHIGFLDRATARTLAEGRFSLFFFQDSPLFVSSAYGLLLASAVLLAAGVWPRCMATIVYVLTLSFSNRFDFVGAGADKIIIFVSFFLIFIPTHHSFTFDLKTRRCSPGLDVPVAGVSLRMIQVNLWLVMLSAVLFKIQDPRWMNGTAMRDIWTYQQTTANWAFLARHPLVVNSATYVSLATEFFFTVAIWIPATRRIALFSAMGLLVGISLFLNTCLFSEVYLASLTAFMRLDDLKVLREQLLKLGRSTRKLCDPKHFRSARSVETLFFIAVAAIWTSQTAATFSHRQIFHDLNSYMGRLDITGFGYWGYVGDFSTVTLAQHRYVFEDGSSETEMAVEPTKGLFRSVHHYFLRGLLSREDNPDFIRDGFVDYMCKHGPHGRPLAAYSFEIFSIPSAAMVEARGKVPFTPNSFTPALQKRCH